MVILLISQLLTVAAQQPPPPRDADLTLGTVESVDLPFDHDQLAVTVRGSAPNPVYQDGSVAATGAITMYSRLHVRSGSVSGVRVLAQFRLEGERVGMMGTDQRVTKGALGVTALYLSPRLDLYGLYVGGAIAESRETLDAPKIMPTVLGFATHRSSDHLSWIYGGGFGYAFGRPWLLPAAGVLWRPTEAWNVSTLLPVFADVARTLGEHVTADVIASVSGDTFGYTDQGETLRARLAQGRAGLGVTYRWGRHWAWRAEGGAYIWRHLDGMPAPTSGYLSTKVTYAFGTAK